MKISSSDRRATSSAGACALSFLVAACAGSPPRAAVEAPPGASSAPRGAAVDFAFDSLDERPVSSEATRGKVTVLVFVTTGSLVAQAQVDYVVAMAKNDADRVNYAVVALETRDNRELVELYRKALSIPFPAAMADAGTMAGAGGFHDVSAVPVTVVLDEAGRVAFRADGRVAKSDEIRAAMRGVRQMTR